jgi:predicted SnoaL-like aldol condensation-catalyzing enzyme
VSGQPEAATVHRRIIELFTAGRRAEALTLIDPHAVDHRGGAAGDHEGVDAWQVKWENMADVSLAVEQNVSEGPFSVNRYRIRGTDAESGRSYEVVGIDMVRVEGGKIVEHWALLDSAAMRHQTSCA